MYEFQSLKKASPPQDVVNLHATKLHVVTEKHYIVL